MAAYYSGNGTWWVSESDGNSFDTKLWSSNFSPNTGWTFLPGDFNGDGNSDIANFHPGNGTWWVSESDGNSFATPVVPDFAPNTGWTFLLGDFNNDGNEDIANFYRVTAPGGSANRRGTVRHHAVVSNFSPRTGWTFILGDFNGDGRDRHRQLPPGNGTWWVSLSTGNGFTTTKWAPTSRPHRMDLHTPATSTETAERHRQLLSGQRHLVDQRIHREQLHHHHCDLQLLTKHRIDRISPGDFNGDGRDDIANYYSGNNTCG